MVSCEWTDNGRGVSYPPRRERVIGSMPGSETRHMTTEWWLEVRQEASPLHSSVMNLHYGSERNSGRPSDGTERLFATFLLMVLIIINCVLPGTPDAAAVMEYSCIINQRAEAGEGAGCTRPASLIRSLCGEQLIKMFAVSVQASVKHDIMWLEPFHSQGLWVHGGSDEPSEVQPLQHSRGKTLD